MCHYLRSPYTPAVFHFVIGCLQISGPSIGAARPHIDHGPPYLLVTLLLSPQCDLCPCTASIAPLCHVPL
ncbi:unnamed protein product [Staurois parvus]|uniref:Uncharacterized protein n=1 Tax=Staurois parvus TaxID=386267 RepID=A0ABN9B324_9NEOB|nr:unnamed protein product [Staurois parvus]